MELFFQVQVYKLDFSSCDVPGRHSEVKNISSNIFWYSASWLAKESRGVFAEFATWNWIQVTVYRQTKGGLYAHRVIKITGVCAPKYYRNTMVTPLGYVIFIVATGGRQTHYRLWTLPTILEQKFMILTVAINMWIKWYYAESEAVHDKVNTLQQKRL